MSSPPILVLARALHGDPRIGVGRRLTRAELRRARRDPDVVATLLLVRWLNDDGARSEAAVERMAADLERAPLVELEPAMTCYLEAAAAGLTVPRTAAVFGVSTETVKTSLKRARHRLDARNTTHAVAQAIRAGLL